ncbi:MULTISPECIES: hypothetical protein [Pseudomonas]|uniref:Lipoprotein n=2 Tax=Pseudomonas TaxID=286 RepID=A0A0W0HE24_PSEFL|nr:MULTISPECIES: hypothetical protein [Pseudomonas]KTB59099.1 hypothetical protein AO063_03510 [Pseudomonas fluorescens ICMP 11288]RMQ90415.1 hypothetical protein ALP97_200164 [Pseudomonas salomonii]
MKPLYLCTVLLLAGCAPAPKYLVPAGAPQAMIRSELVSMENYRNNVTLVQAPAIGCKYGRTVATESGIGKQLVSVSENVSTPEGYFPIEAGKPMHLEMRGMANAHRSCSVSFISEFAPGARYVIKGGIADVPGSLSRCYIDIFNVDTGVRVSTAKEPKIERTCALDQLPTF